LNINVTLFGQAITFAIFVWFTMKYVWPPITQAMQARQKKMADGLAAAEQGVESLNEAKQQAEYILQEARAKASEMMDKASKQAGSIVEESKHLAVEEGKRLIHAAKLEIEQEKLRVKQQLQVEVVNIAMMGAEKVLNRSIDAQAHRDLLNQLATQL